MRGLLSEERIGQFNKEEMMEITIETNDKGKPTVIVYGSSKNSAKQVAKAYKEAVAELKKEDS